MNLKVVSMSAAIAFAAGVSGVALTGCATPATPATACPVVQATCKGMTAQCKGMTSCKGKSYKHKNLQAQ
ncbi:MAG: hypothetical protein WBE18_02865 [Gammaproteobacteria bacterium]